MTSLSNASPMWLVTGLDIDYDWPVAVCATKEEAMTLVKELEAEQSEEEYPYSYFIGTVLMYKPKEDKD